MGGPGVRQAHGLREATGSAKWRANATGASRLNPASSSLRRWLIAATVSFGLAVASAVAQQPGPDELAAMDDKALDEYIALVTATVVQDSVRLPGYADARNCPEINRAANSLSLAYEALGEVLEVTRERTGAAAAGRRSRLVQSRVIGFAARVRADEYIASSCRSYRPAGEQADDPRYAAAPRLADSLFTRAIIEARLAAETNLAIAAAARESKDCRLVGNAIRSIQLLLPYLEKLAKDVESRPLALGPLASKRGLEQVRNQSVSAANSLDREFGVQCGQVGPAQPAPTQPPDSEG